MNDRNDLMRIVAAFAAGETVSPVERRAAAVFYQALSLPADRRVKRNALLVQLRRRFYPTHTDHAASHNVASDWRSYAADVWRRERSNATCPQRHVGTAKELFWQMMKLVPEVLSPERIRKIVGHGDRLK